MDLESDSPVNFSEVGVIHYAGGNATKPCPLPTGAKQPLFGFGEQGLEPVYYTESPTGQCFVGAADDEKRPTCLASTRNNEAPWGPAIVVFPLEADHVVTAVKFARHHNLCVSVLGTGYVACVRGTRPPVRPLSAPNRLCGSWRSRVSPAVRSRSHRVPTRRALFALRRGPCVVVVRSHDYMNRHDGCPDGMLIRTTLLKTIEWDLDDTRGFGWKDGTVRVGSGHTFNEIGHSASDRDRMVASGWTRTVGVAGWSLGGGHGQSVHYTNGRRGGRASAAACCRAGVWPWSADLPAATSTAATA